MPQIQSAPRGLRLHIGIFGRRNAGKSSLMNGITAQNVSIVSDVAGTTTDPVEKPMEFLPLGPVLFMGGILLTTVYSCSKELRQSAAALMRPKSPKPGSRVFLEHIRPVWRRMSFLRKVTARNLFRYKSRMLMTVLGIGGCMALLLFGFALRDSVTELSPGQYNHILRYGLMAVSDENGDTAKDTLDDAMDSDLISRYTNAAITCAVLQT